MSLGYIILLIAPLLGGCVSTNTPDDLAFVSVQAVDVHDQPELPGPGASPILGMVSNRELESRGQSISGGEKSHKAILKVEFTSATDLSKFVMENSYNLGSEAFFCDHQPGSPFVGYPFVFWHGIRLGEYETDPIEHHNEPRKTPITYYFFVLVSLPKVVPSNPPQEGFDLRRQPADVCFYLRGGNESGRGYKSNTVLIPKSAIAAALQKVPNLP